MRGIGRSLNFLSEQLSSFKVKLVLYFLMLALLPLAALFWGFTGVASRTETRFVDSRLTAGLHSALGAYQQTLSNATRVATALARLPEFQTALARRDRLVLTRIIQNDPNLRFVAPGGFRVGVYRRLSAQRVVNVVDPGGLVGKVIASVPLDAALTQSLRSRIGLDPEDRIVILSRGIVVAGPLDLTDTSAAWSGEPQTVNLGGKRYRAVASRVLAAGNVSFAVLTPRSTIDAANRAFQRRYLYGLLLSIALLGIVAMLQGRAILKSIGRLVSAANAVSRGSLGERVPVKGRDELATLGRSFNQMADQLKARLDELESERKRLRDAFSRLGEALGATHDAEQLLRVIVETAVEATGATGGILVAQGGEMVQIGTPEDGEESLELPLQAGDELSFGTLILYGSSFSYEQRMTAVSLAAQAVVALDNARLHRIVERQALLDGLTGLANRRQSEDALTVELARAERLGGPVSVVLADLDDFKDVNDRYGHLAGDAALREFAAVLRENVREIDTAGRWGGEEFLVLLPGTDGAGATRLAARLRIVLEGRTILGADGTPLRVTASFGVASAPSATTWEELVADADAALYEAKRAGKNRVETASPPIHRP